MVDTQTHPHIRFRKRTWVTTIAVTAALGALAAGMLTVFVSAPTRHVATQQPDRTKSHSVAAAASPKTATAPAGLVSTGGSPAPGATSVSVTSSPTAVASAPASVSGVQPVATLVSEVEASGMQPGSNWTWTMGDTATYCGPISGSGTGCTYGEAGLEHTTFSGTPTLALVAHELANAETQNDAVPSLLQEVADAAAGTSWSPTDAVASCLVEHFMGFQDDAAGTWQCPVALATTVAEHIHDAD